MSKKSNARLIYCKFNSLEPDRIIGEQYISSPHQWQKAIAGKTKRKTKRKIKQQQKLKRAIEAGINRWRTLTNRNHVNQFNYNYQDNPDFTGSVNGLLTDRSHNKQWYKKPTETSSQHHQPNNFNSELPPTGWLKVNKDVNFHPPIMKQLRFKASFFKVLSRLFIWFNALFNWYWHILLDKFTRNDSVERRARRLRETIEKVGGSAIKIGQQLAMRIDLFPYAYSIELSKLLDTTKPFSTSYAIKRIEAQTGKKISELFTDFDPVPIGSASIACVFQAILKSGDRVAIKVRRPEIGETIVADCQALGWLLSIAEFLMLIPPGFTRNALFEFTQMLIDELDFEKEARYTELFRREVKKKFNFITAPRVYFELSSSEVMVSEHVSGIWLGELLTAVEQKDQQALAYLRTLNIDPKTVAKRLIRTNQFGVFEANFFHADPHPSNVLIQPDSRLVFIDFGACGAFPDRERHVWRQMVYYHYTEDIEKMVQSAIALLEPIRPIDIDEFTKKLETVFLHNHHCIKSKNSQWFERTTATLWLGLFKLMRDYNLPMNLSTLRTIRSTLLYETISFRLYNQMNIYHEIRNYNERIGRRARRRMYKGIRKRLKKGLTDADYLKIDQLFELGNRFVYLTQRTLDHAPFHFSIIPDKFSDVITLVISALTTIIIPSTLVISCLIIFKLPKTDEIDLIPILKSYLFSKPFIIFVLIILFIYLRRIMFRLSDREIVRRNTTGLN